jgi:hypothetical protein
MTSKNDGRISFYSKTNVIATSCFNSPIVVGSTPLTQTLLKTQCKQMMAILQSFVIRCRMHKKKDFLHHYMIVM